MRCSRSQFYLASSHQSPNQIHAEVEHVLKHAAAILVELKMIDMLSSPYIGDYKLANCVLDLLTH